MTVYLLDANVFMSASRLHYGLDFCPAFWDWIIAQNAAGVVFSIEKVASELAAGNDDLASWCKALTDSFFLPPDQSVLRALGRVSAWVSDPSQNYEQGAVSTFLQVADYYLVGHALAHGYVVVTHEVPANSTKRIKIPNACVGLSVKFMTPFEMLRRERARFILGATP